MENNEVRTGQKWGIWLFLIYTMVTLLLCLLFFFMLKVPFSSDADYLQAGITGGAMGTGADQTAQYYLSALLTTALARAGAELDIFNIYSVFLMGLCFLTFTAMHWLVTKRADTILFHLVIFAFMICALLEFNYLTIAFLAAGSGILSVFGIRGSDHIVSRLFSWLLGILLIAGGCGLRLFVLPAAILLLLPLFLRGLMDHNGIRWLAAIILMAAVCAGTFMTTGARLQRIYGDPWGSYASWADASYLLQTSDLPDRTEYADLYKNISWTDNDFALMENRTFADTAAFGTQKLLTLAEGVDMHERFEFDARAILDMVLTGRDLFVFLPAGAMAAAILLGLFGRAKWRDLGLILLSGVITCAMAGSLYFCRMVYSRLMLPLLILGLMEILIILGVSVREKNEETDTDRTLTVMIVQAAVLVSVCYLFGTVYFSRLTPETAGRGSELRSYLASHSDSLCCCTSEAAYELQKGLPVIGHTADKYPSNLIDLGGRDSFSGRFEHLLAAYGTEDAYALFRSMAENDRILLITGQEEIPEEIALYVQEHYGIPTVVTETDRIGTAYRVYSLQASEDASESGGADTADDKAQTSDAADDKAATADTGAAAQEEGQEENTADE